MTHDAKIIHFVNKRWQWFASLGIGSLPHQQQKNKTIIKLFFFSKLFLVFIQVECAWQPLGPCIFTLIIS